VPLNSIVQQIPQKLDDNVSEASRQLREQGRQTEQKVNNDQFKVQEELRQLEQEVEIASESCIKENHESSSGFVENVTGSVVETLRPLTDKELDSELPKKADVTGYPKDKHEVEVQEKPSNVDPRDLQEKDLEIILEQSKTINVAQKPQLFEVSNKFFPNFTERLGKCRLLKYRFQANSEQFLRSFSRRVPFAFRPVVEFQIQNKVKGGRFKKICQKSPDEPRKEDLPTIILKAHVKVRNKAK
jgi:hypothetical protein